MERLLEILSEIKEDVDFSTCTTLIDDASWTLSTFCRSSRP